MGRAVTGAVAVACCALSLYGHAQPAPSTAPAAAASSPAAAAPAPAEPKFEIRRYVVDGATLITEQEITRATAPYAGTGKDFADVQRALEALEKLYSEKGYTAVQVVLPEQELDKGEVHFTVVEAKVGRIIVEGNKFFSEENIKRSVPSLVPGKAPNINEIAKSLKAANDNPAKQTTALLRSGADEGTVDALLRVTDEKPVKYSVTLDNTGTQQTGIFRLGFGYQNSNLWNRDHAVSFQYVMSPSQESNPNSLTLWPNKNVLIAGGAYRIPLYQSGDTLEFSGGYSNVNSGVITGLFGQFNVSGAGTILSGRYNHNLPKWGEVEQKVAAELGWRAYNNRTLDTAGQQVLPDVTVHPISLTYSGAYRTAVSESDFYFTGAKNLPGGNDGGTGTFTAVRFGASPGYTIWRYGVNYNRAFDNDWQTHFAFNGQATRNRLVAGEQFGAGGADSVRGFQEREIANDNGFRGTVEAYTPDWGNKVPFVSGVRARALAFYDWAHVQRFGALDTDLKRVGIASFGLGTRFSRGSNISLRLDYGVVLDAGGSQGRWEGRVHGSFAYIF